MTQYAFGWLGAVVPDQDQAWSSYLQGLQQNLNTSWAQGKAAYLTLKSVREKLGLPFITSQTNESNPDTGGWADDFEAQAQDIQAMVTLLDQAATDVLADKRKLMWNQELSDFSISGLPGDVLRLDIVQGVVMLVDTNTGKQVHVSGQIGILPILWLAAGVAVVQGIAAYLIVDKACQTFKTMAEQKTQRTLAEAAKKHADLVAAGKATPEQAKSLNDSMYAGAAEFQKQQAAAEAAKNKPTSDWTDTLKTLGYIALGVAGLYTIVQLVPKPAPRAAPAYLENPPKVQSGYAYATGIAYGLRGMDWQLASGKDWETVIVDAGGRYQHLGTRLIDGSRVNVWRDSKNKRYVAQTVALTGQSANPKQGWVAEMFVDGAWSRNAIVLPSKKQAEAYASDLFSRWTMPTDKRVKRVAQPPNYEWTSEGLKALPQA